MCSRCEVVKPLRDFGKNGTTLAGTPKLKPRCFKCDSAWEHERFQKKVIKAVGGAQNLKCATCGYDKCVAALEFHHLDPTNKFKAISKMQNYSAALIEEEISKCVILCCRCHREHHHGMLEL